MSDLENSRLDLTYYQGEDLYSDGDIEDRLLDIVQKHGREEFNQIIAEEKNWPILYHLSNIRENILSWYPFSENDEVLEIGSGCGALTGCLARRVKQVTCVELSRKRSLINVYQNRDCDNIRIMVGNFEDIEPDGLGRYDIITLIGVLEYANSYISSDQPYHSFLRTIAKHLKPNGKILIAIENRLGLKYWAGCSEDHNVGAYYEGIEGYPSTDRARTFSRKELEELCRSLGDYDVEFYYPHPDYKLPVQIFSDRGLPGKHTLKNNRNRNYDQKRIVSFDEDAVFDSLIDNDLYPQFANSFFVSVGKPGHEKNNGLVSAKFSNDRNPAFSISTMICEDEQQGKYLLKKAADGAAAEHVRSIYQKYTKLKQQFQNSAFSINTCAVVDDETVRLEFIPSAQTLKDILYQHAANNDEEGLLQEAALFYERLKSVCVSKVFQESDAFLDVFGDCEVCSEKEAYVFESLCDIDLVFDNIMLNDGQMTIIDYEWTFDFDVPLKYVIWRAVYAFEVNELKVKYRHLGALLYQRLGITEAERECFLRMEHRFQQYVCRDHATLSELHNEISLGYMDAKETLETDPLSVKTIGVPTSFSEAYQTKARVQQLESELQLSRDTVSRQSELIKSKEEEIETICRSTSWKITKPIRIAMDKVRNK